MEENSQHGLRINFGHNWQLHLKFHCASKSLRVGFGNADSGLCSEMSFRRSGVWPKNLHLLHFPSDCNWRNIDLLVSLYQEMH